MGNKHSSKAHHSGGSSAQQAMQHSPVPEDVVPYDGGPTYEYRVVEVKAKMNINVSFGFTAGKTVASTDVQSFYNTLQQQYGEYYRLKTFFQVPMSTKMSGFTGMSASMPFQGWCFILCNHNSKQFLAH